MDEDVIEKCLVPVWMDTTFYKWSGKYATVECNSCPCGELRSSHIELQKRKKSPPPMYMGKKTVRVNIKEALSLSYT